MRNATLEPAQTEELLDAKRPVGSGLLRLRHTGVPRPGSRLVVAVVSDSLEDVEVVRQASILADRPGARLVLAVPLAGGSSEPSLPVGVDDASLPDDARAAVGRVRPVLETYGIPYQVLVVPYRDRGGPRRCSRRIAAALLRSARMLHARRLVVGEYACWQPGAPTVAARLTAAGERRAVGRVAISVVGTSGIAGAVEARQLAGST